MLDILSMHRQLAQAACTSGNEDGIARTIASLAAPFCDEISRDALGNLICHKKGSGKRIMCAAHMDAIGLMVSFIDEHGYLFVAPIGGHYPYELLNTRVRFNKVCGIVKLCKAAENMGKTGREVGFNDIYIDIGARSREDALKYVSVGDTALFESEVRALGGTRIMAPYADDLAGCILLLCALEQSQKSKNDIWAVFTVQEELGCFGAKTSAFALKPDIGIAIDVTTAGDCPAESEHHNGVKLGGGAAIKIMDSSVYCSRGLNGLLHRIAQGCNIPVQDEILRGGGTDTSEMLLSREGVPSTCISIPTRNIHMPVEIYDTSDVIAGARLLSALLCAKL